MTARARRSKRKGPFPGKARQRSRRSPALKPSLPFVSGAGEQSVETQESQLSDQRTPERDPSAGQETSLKAWLYFFWRVSKDKESQAGFFRLVCIAMIPIVFVTAAYLIAPAPVLWKAIIGSGAITLTAIGTTIRSALRRRRSGGLTAIRLAPGPASPVTAAQEPDGRIGEPYRDRSEHSSDTGPDQYAHPPRELRRSPRANRRRRNPSFRPVGNQRQPVTATIGPPAWLGCVWRGQTDSGMLVSAHLIDPIAPATLLVCGDSATAPTCLLREVPASADRQLT